MKKEKNIRIAEFNLKNVNTWIEFADKKASFILTIALALFSISFSIIPNGWHVISDLLIYENKAQLIAGIVLIIAFGLYFTMAILGIGKLIGIIIPRTTPTTKRKSILHFESIAEMELEKFKQKISNLSEEQIIDELSDQAYNNAVVALTKYNNVAAAVKFLKIAGSIGIVFVIVILIL